MNRLRVLIPLMMQAVIKGGSSWVFEHHTKNWLSAQAHNGTGWISLRVQVDGRSSSKGGGVTTSLNLIATGLGAGELTTASRF